MNFAATKKAITVKLENAQIFHLEDPTQYAQIINQIVYLMESDAQHH